MMAGASSMSLGVTQHITILDDGMTLELWIHSGIQRRSHLSSCCLMSAEVRWSEPRCRATAPARSDALVLQRFRDSLSRFAVANDLDGRGSKHATVKSHLWLSNTHAHSLHRRVVLKDHGCDALRHRLRQRNRRSFHDRTNLTIYLAVVNGLRQVIA
jgi:hypothetical protein